MPSPLRRRPRGSAGEDGWPGVPDEARRRVRRGRIAVVVVVSLVVVALGVAIGVLAPADLLEPSASSTAWAAVGLGLVLVGIATVVVAGLRARRAGALRLAWNSPTATWPRARRRHLLAQVRQDLPVAPEERADAVAVADLLVGQRAVVPVYAGFALFVLGQSRPRR